MFSRPGGAYVSCTTCGTARIDPLPEVTDAASLFDDDYFVGGAVGGYADYDADEALHRRNARDRLARLPKVPASVLDVGCASGF